MSRNAVGRPRRSRIMRLSTVPSGRSTLVAALAVAVLAALAPVGNAAGGGGRTGGVGGHGGELGGVRGGSDVSAFMAVSPGAPDNRRGVDATPAPPGTAPRRPEEPRRARSVVAGPRPGGVPSRLVRAAARVAQPTGEPPSGGGASFCGSSRPSGSGKRADARAASRNAEPAARGVGVSYGHGGAEAFAEANRSP